jgi:hypothetical protein
VSNREPGTTVKAAAKVILFAQEIMDADSDDEELILGNVVEIEKCLAKIRRAFGAQVPEEPTERARGLRQAERMARDYARLNRSDDAIVLAAAFALEASREEEEREQTE